MKKFLFPIILIVMSSISLPVVSQSLDSLKIQKLINKARKKYNIPAIAITLMNNTSIYVNEVHGLRVFGQPDLVTPEDLFHIGSCSKSFLAVAAAKLVETGKITWQTKLFDVLPELKEGSDPAYSEITLEDLFLCKAGIQPYITDEETFSEVVKSNFDENVEFVKYLLKLKPAVNPVEGKFDHLYSNAGYSIIAVMLERIDGLTYEDRMRNLLNSFFKIPLHIGFPNKLQTDQPWGHLVEKGHVKKFSPKDEYQLHRLLIPAGDLSMTPTDFSRYIQFHLQGLLGQDNALKSSTLKHMHYGHQGFSLGVVNSQWGDITFSGMDGSAGTFFCRAILIPDEDFAFTIMMNAGSGSGQMKAITWLTEKIVKKQYGWWWKFWL